MGGGFEEFAEVRLLRSRTLVTSTSISLKRNPVVERNVLTSHPGRFGEPTGLGEPINLGDVDHPPAAFARDFNLVLVHHDPLFAALDCLVDLTDHARRNHAMPRRHDDVRAGLWVTPFGVTAPAVGFDEPGLAPALHNRAGRFVAHHENSPALLTVSSHSP